MVPTQAQCRSIFSALGHRPLLEFKVSCRTPVGSRSVHIAASIGKSGDEFLPIGRLIAHPDNVTTSNITATYQGELFCNVIDSKSGKKRPPADWIAIPVDPIVDAETFQRAAAARGPEAIRLPPRLVSSPILLTGLLKCGHCHAGMTLPIGKSGKYRYYKCTTCVNKGNAQCPSCNIPMEKLDELVLEHMASRVFASRRLQLMLTEARRSIRIRTAVDRQKIATLQVELRKADDRLSKIYEAVETGVLPLDETLQRRVKLAKSSRENVLIEIAGLRRLQTLQVERILPSQVEAFGMLIGKRLRDRSPTR